MTLCHSSGLGIELVNGGNTRLPFPVLTSAVSNGNTITVAGLIQSTPNTDLTLEFFANLVCNPSGFGEGEQFLGSWTVLTNSHGTVSFSVPFAVSVPPGQFIAATATDPSNNTSAFSACVVVAPQSTPPSGGGLVAFVAMVGQPNDSTSPDGGIDSPLSSSGSLPAWSVQSNESLVSQMPSSRYHTEEIFSTARRSVAALTHPMGSLNRDVLDLLAVSLLFSIV